jgi:sterol desaturase/sphingolipid hydroxylase (fatty acid hydroxylase superfamily)
VWPLICALPLALTLDLGFNSYKAIFPAAWYDEAPFKPPRGVSGFTDPRDVNKLGLILGILAVAVGQIFTLGYHLLRHRHFLGATRRIQPKAVTYDFFKSLSKHASNPEGLILMSAYLTGTWVFGLMPVSYYAFGGGINWKHVAAQLLLQDFIQYGMHFAEHKVSSWIYRNSHKPHHRFTNPQLFDAFDGSITDTVLMILVPLFITAHLVPSNVWSYMTFGSLYANWLMLIHSECSHPWDWAFRKIGFGTAADHHVHHHFFLFNYGHLFMYWDKVFGTYRNPKGYAGMHFSKEF